MKSIARMLTVSAIALFAHQAAAQETWSLPVKSRAPAFDAAGVWESKKYVPLQASELSKKWDICVLFPHTKDPYYVSMTYGAVKEAEEKGISLTVYAAGGYTELPQQISQMEDCLTRGADGIMMVAISDTGLDRSIDAAAAKGVPVVITGGGDVGSTGVGAKALGQYTDTGLLIGNYLNAKHPAGGEKTKILWMAGPEGPRWSRDATDGFLETVKDNDSIEVVKVIWGDAGKTVQIPLIEDALQVYPDIKYIGGIAPAIEGAIQVLKEKNRTDIGLLSYYISPEVEQGVREGTVLGVVTDLTAAQARLGVDQAVRLLEKKGVEADVDPGFMLIDSSNIDTYDRSLSLAPVGWEPYFQVD